MLPITRLYADEHGHARPGDVLLVEDTAGVGHSSRSSEGASPQRSSCWNLPLRFSDVPVR
jgi:hypothetical protein